MAPKTLRFRARGTALVQHFEKMEAGVKRFLGFKYTNLEGDTWAFVPTGEVEEVKYEAEYVQACKDGCLWAADKETAAACGVPFDPNFGSPPPAASASASSAPKSSDTKG